MCVSGGRDGSLSTTTYRTHMPVNGRNALVCSRLEQLAGDDLLDGEHDTIFAANAYRRASIFDSLEGIFGLEVASVG